METPVTYLSMLRGINVSGQKLIKMTDLQRLYEALGFTGVQTYIQSGNVVFGAHADPKEVTQHLEQGIRERFGFEVPMVIRTWNQLRATLENNPFLSDDSVDPNRSYVAFLTNRPAPELSRKLATFSCEPDRFVIREEEIYFYCPVAYGHSKLSNNFFENQLKVVATTRNWKTVNELAKRLQNYSAGGLS